MNVKPRRARASSSRLCEPPQPPSSTLSFDDKTQPSSPSSDSTNVHFPFLSEGYSSIAGFATNASSLSLSGSLKTVVFSVTCATARSSSLLPSPPSLSSSLAVTSSSSPPPPLPPLPPLCFVFSSSSSSPPPPL